MITESLNKKLDDVRMELKASSCTLYIRDPDWIDEYRLVALSNVLREEAMHGFLSPESARRVVFEGDTEIFSTAAFKDRRFRERPVDMLDIPEAKRSLFGDFVDREGIRSSARLTQLNESGERFAILFVNYSTQTEFTEPLKTEIRAGFKEVLAVLKRVWPEIISRDAIWLQQMTKIVGPAWSVANLEFQLVDEPDSYFNAVLEAILKTLGITHETGLGTVHLYNPEEYTLDLHGYFGNIQYRKEAEKHQVRDGHGVTSWVAIRKRALLVRDLDKSDYKQIHVSINDQVRSELVVPLEAEGELIGVVCLECIEPDRFQPHHVRSVWYAANKAAVAYILHQHGSLNRKLLRLCSEATGDKTGARESLNKLALLANDFLKASFCEIWRFNSDTDNFDTPGASYEGFLPRGRPEGWTRFVQREKIPIWFSNIKTVSDYSIHHWKEDEWREGAPEGDSPPELNPVVVETGIHSELAIPITIRGKIAGIAWVKYKRKGLECPKPGLMSLALGFAAQAGLVMDSIQRQEVDLKDKERIDFVGGDIFSAAHSRWLKEECSIVDSAVISLPHHSKLGGDLYARKTIDENTVGILLVDGQGHGVEGSLHMLPLLTAFESFWQSYSSAHVISQMIKTAEAVGVRGTAIYCVISVIENKRWLCVTSAGHDPLIVFKRESGGSYSSKSYPESTARMLGIPLKEPLMDHRIELTEGDIIIGYTDGLAEKNEKFSANNIASLVFDLLSKGDDDPRNIAATIVQNSKEKHPNGFEDDATVFVVRIR